MLGKISQASVDTAECQGSEQQLPLEPASAQAQAWVQTDRRRRKPSKQAQPGRAGNVRGGRLAEERGELFRVGRAYD